MFECQWKLHDENNELIDLDTLPDKRNIREKLNLIEAETLSNAASEISKANEIDNRAITHVIDSTTKKRVGQFATQGIHIGRNVPFPLSLINIAGETTEDIALQVDFGMEVLAAVQGKEAKDVYKLIDVHMTQQGPGGRAGRYLRPRQADRPNLLRLAHYAWNEQCTEHASFCDRGRYEGGAGVVQVYGRNGAGQQERELGWPGLQHDAEAGGT